MGQRQYPEESAGCRNAGNGRDVGLWSGRWHELQADCFAGVWAFHANRARKILESGDLEEALNAATQIGDDTLQRSAGRGSVSPDSFTHGSSEQRVRWFKAGIGSGDMQKCDTFAARQL